MGMCNVRRVSMRLTYARTHTMLHFMVTVPLACDDVAAYSCRWAAPNRSHLVQAPRQNDDNEYVWSSCTYKLQIIAFYGSLEKRQGKKKAKRKQKQAHGIRITKKKEKIKSYGFHTIGCGRHHVAIDRRHLF